MATTKTKVRTPLVRVNYVSLAKVNKDGKFAITGIYDRNTASDDDKQAMKNLIHLAESTLREAVKDLPADYTVSNWLKGQRGAFNYPFRMGGEPGVPWLAKPEHLGKIIITMSSKPKFSETDPNVIEYGAVGCCNAHGVSYEPKEAPQVIYSGCYCLATVTAFAYNKKTKGVSFGLQSVRKIRDGEPLASGFNAEDDYADVKGEAPDTDNSAEFGNDADDFI